MSGGVPNVSFFGWGNGEMRKSGPSVEGMDLGENVGILVLVGMKFVKKKSLKGNCPIWG